jgi:hypothetical protein
VIARHLGVSRSWASREANAPGTRIFIADLFELCRERVKALFDQTLDLIEDAMNARQFLVVNRVLVDVGPDHYAQLEAVRMFTLLMPHAGNGRRYVQVPGTSGIGVSEPRGVRAANTRRGLEPNPERVKGCAFGGALRTAPRRLNAVAEIHAAD